MAAKSGKQAGKTSPVVYKCNQCPFTCTLKTGLRQHSVIHLDKSFWQFKCNLCNYSGKRKNDIDSHMLSHSEEKPFKCSVPECNYRAKHPQNVTHHYKVVHDGSKPFHCNTPGCDYRTKTNSCLKKHMESRHSAKEKDKVCPLCDKKFHRLTCLEQHMKVHTREKPFECSECSYRAATKPTLVRHLVVHKDERPFVCSYPDCGYAGKLKDHLKGHERRHQQSGRRDYKCPLCPKVFGSSEGFKSHIGSHTGEKTDKCQHCEFRTNKRSYLSRHEATHHKKDDSEAEKLKETSSRAATRAKLSALRVTVGAPEPRLKLAKRSSGIKPFGCDQCEFRAASNSILKKHAYVHNEDRPFLCTFEGCGHRSKKKSFLKSHLKSHDTKRKRDFHCALCSKKFFSIKSLQTHIDTHTGEKWYKCLFCTYAANTAQCLNVHLLHTHKEEIK